MEPQIKSIPVELDGGLIVRVQATAQDNGDELVPEIGEEIETDVSVQQRLKEVNDAIVGIAKTIKGTLDEVKPTKASVEFGLEFGFESGKLTALIVQGSEKANLKIALEWESDKK